MLRLKERQRQIPNGLRFYLPEVNWRSTQYASFEVISAELLSVIRANPALAQRNQWPTTLEAVKDWVDTYNATICAKMGWTEYYLDTAVAGGPIPKAPAPHLQASLSAVAAAADKAKALVAGAKTLMEWDESGDPPVSPELSTNRAIVCSKCPLNKKGDWTEWFTAPAAELIRRRLAKAHNRGLSTPRDDALHNCEVCMCPLKLKVHIPIDWIRRGTKPEVMARLEQVPGCWIPAEAGG